MLKESLDGAETEIRERAISGEIVEPLLRVVGILKRAFRPEFLAEPIPITADMLRVYVGYISMALLAVGAQPKVEHIPEADDLASEIDNFSASIDWSGVDPAVVEILKKKMAALATLLRHIPVFGMEAALETYWSLVFSVSRAKADAVAPKEASKADEPKKSLLVKLGEWLSRLTQIDQALEAGTKLIEHAGDAAKLLEHLPFP
ncbi:hypothetical protein [Sphingomonas sp. PP-F2F-G114-C0414]|uniref:hypothetical protein n=1 Tax=Sphingomonas sp. PP-F2F-G114-C0414 TaxID=2135662 RepID=UPI0011C3A8F1|nr:hypothetical protein [Sphingomonas sp. PP-F2F-G114-C0414]